MIGGGALARRYAKALFDLGRELGSTEQLLQELDGFVSVATENPELGQILFTPIHPREDRKRVITAVGTKMQLSKEVRAFLAILVGENRTSLLVSIRDALREMVDQAAGRLEARVTSARPLDDAQQEELRAALSRRVGAEVSLSMQVDPTLIGGVVARVGDLLLDGSVRTQLANVASSLRRGST